MSNKNPVDTAVALARGLIAGRPPLNSPVPELIALVRDFSTVEFDVPDIADADGYLFQYGRVSWFPEPTFVLSIVRQLAVAENFVQVQFEFRYALDDELDTVGSHSEWWFPESGTSFDSWLSSVERSSIMDVVEPKTCRVFEIYQDQAGVQRFVEGGRR
jgi:hypothetical protein